MISFREPLPVVVRPLVRAARWRLWPLALSASLFTAACGDNNPTEPGKPVVQPEQMLPDGGTLSGLIVESLERVLPTLPEGGAREEVIAALGQLSVVLQTKSVSYVKVALASADASITRYESMLVDEPSSLAELGGVRLTLDAIAADLAVVGK